MTDCGSAGVLLPGPVGFKESGVVDDGGQQRGEGPEQEGREELGHDGVLRRSSVCVSVSASMSASVSTVQEDVPGGPTFRYSTGLVTLNLSMVEMMMAGVVRKKSRRKRMQLMRKQRIHQEAPPRDRCSLQEQRSAYGAPGAGGGAPHLPADVLRVGGVGHAPPVDLQDLAELGRARFLVAPAALDLARVEVLQDTEERGAGPQ